MPTTASTKPRSIRSLARALAAHAVQLHDELQVRLLSGDQQLQSARDSLAADLGREVSVDEAANVIAQAATCGGVIVASKPQEWNSATRWFHVQASDWERCALQEIRTEYSVLRTQYSVLDIPASSSAHFYETFLHAYQRCTRKQRGVFFTPAPIADFIVRQVDERLRGEFGLAQGLAAAAGPPYREADASRSPCVLDPACGTGVFLLAVIERLHCQLGDDWNAVVPKILPRLIGIEILPAAAFLAKLNIALKLAATGYSFRQPGSINIRIGDALEPNLQFEICNLKSAIPVVVGNPPFSSLSTNTNPWIARLVRGDDVVCGYVRANGRSLGERKTWLHDDYVKFIRLAQWHVEQAGQGIVGFVTNHGYLDNATFRLMRSELLRAFPHIQIVDLHGSRKKGEQSPDGSRDENVFGLDQGTAISILTRSVSEGVTPTRSVSEGVIPRIEYAELWGSRDEKLAALGTPSLTLRVTIRPAAPDWRFVPTRKTVHPEYDAGWPLTELMPVNTPAPVTARDHFVVAFHEEELQRRIAEFRDLAIPDDEIRRRYFTRTRSSRYQPGDTRGWQLSEARRIIAADPDWQRHITRCLYRPFDWRYVFWHPAMIDWPRTEVTRHLLGSQEGGTKRRRDGETSECP
ncbi:MAG TPA: type ISP restriction/modification enzyme, partial [Pirellulaceae bacterium]|nr:type ISP restriction/modification enzyme [Pirellulaceae bacterium]